MRALAEQQQSLLAALWQRRHADAYALVQPHVCASVPQAQAERGLRAYRSNGRALAVRALQAAYPATAQLLGDENFDALAHSLWLAHPPARGDLAQWGCALPTHIESLPDLAEQEPYLSDVARTEWALHQAATVADVTLDAASFHRLADTDPLQLRLKLTPGARVIESAWPVASIVTAHTQGLPSLEEAAARLQARTAETAVVWRQGFKPCVRHAELGEPAFIAALKDNRALADALTAAPELAFDAWLTQAVQTGLLWGVVVCDAPTV